MMTYEEFVAEEFEGYCLREEPKKITVKETIPVFEEYINELKEESDDIPSDITVEQYVEIWNRLCDEYYE